MKTTANQQLSAIRTAIFRNNERSYELRKQDESNQVRATELIDAANYGDEQADALGDALAILRAVYQARKAAQDLDALLSSVPQPAQETNEVDD